MPTQHPYSSRQGMMKTCSKRWTQLFKVSSVLRSNEKTLLESLGLLPPPPIVPLGEKITWLTIFSTWSIFLALLQWVQVWVIGTEFDNLTTFKFFDLFINRSILIPRPRPLPIMSILDFGTIERNSLITANYLSLIFHIKLDENGTINSSLSRDDIAAEPQFAHRWA